MGLLGDKDGETAAIEPKAFNLSSGDTQPLDSRVKPSPLPDEMVRRGSVEKNYRDSMAEFHDTIPIFEQFETQIVNFEEDTQVVDFDDETQLIDDGQCCYENLETQIVDDFDTQVVLDSDSEGSDKTEELHLGDEPSDDNNSIGQNDEKISCNGESRGQTAAALSDELCGSGSIKRAFTSIRAASIRASGLAARAAAQHMYNSEKSSLLSHRKSPQEDTTAQTNERSFITVLSNSPTKLNKRDVDEPKCRSGSSAVRRLFNEDDADLNTEDLHLGDDKIEQLSYIDSQEPGDFSQAAAMDFVDQYLKDNVEELQQESCIKRSGGGNPEDQYLKDNVEELKQISCIKRSGGGNPVAVSSIKGPQNLARKAARVRNQEKGAFDWDDDLEDDRGGDLFSKRKEEFFDGGRKCKSRTEQRKPRVRTSDGNVDRNKPSSLPNIKSGRIVSSSKIISDAKVAEENLARNLGDEFMKESSEPLRGQSELLYTVGFDTQLAAEAMEALCQVDMLTSKDGNTALEGKQNDKDAHLGNYNSIKKTQGRVKEKPKDSVKKKMEEMPLNILQSSKISPIARRTRLSKMTREMHEERYSHQMEIDAAVEEGTAKLKGVPSAATARRTRSMAKRDSSANHQSDRSKGVSEQPLELEWSRQSVPRRKRTSNDACGGNLSWKKQHKSPTSKLSSVGCKPSEEPQPIQNLNCEATSEKDEAPKETSNVSSPSVCITTVSCSTPANEASPVCAGNDYFKFKRSCKKNLSRSYLRKELESLTTALGPEASPTSAVRKRREMADVRVLYSRHLDDDIVKLQKKVLARLGASVADSIADATHFVTDKFVRTRNMLEAIALGKAVVTHLWIESCGQANCFLDERNYILRDAKKEKEMGFSMPVSLARACQHPLLQDQRVFITSNTEPSLGVISALVKAVGGQPSERIGRCGLKDEDDLLILSCEKDYDVCVPFLEKGAAVYSSELLLNGIVTQKLDYERHRLFTDHVKRTRSTVWLKKDGKKFVPVAKTG